MIRSLAIVLVLADLVVLGFGLRSGASGAPERSFAAPEPLPATVRPLRLLAEVPPPGPRRGAGVPGDPGPGPETSAASAGAGLAPESEPEFPSEPPSELASELPSELASESRPGSGATCALLGPLTDAEAAVAVLARARSLGLDGAARSRDVPSGPPDYQVHLPRQASVEQARRLVRELQALDVEAYVMGRSELEGAVSVGLFTDAERARARLEDVARLGYEVRIREVRRTRRVHEVRLQAPDARALDAFVPTLADTWPEIERTPAPCPGTDAPQS